MFINSFIETRLDLQLNLLGTWQWKVIDGLKTIYSVSLAEPKTSIPD